MFSFSEDTPLFPALAPRSHQRIETTDGHSLYVEEVGNPQGIPVVFLHGGPGAGCFPIHRRFFDPRLFRIILFDQRGSGQSRPFAETKDNTTWHLINDMERIRTEFEIDKWIIFGGSWGSTLGLVYGINHPSRCLAFVLRGVFLGTAQEIDWFIHGMGRFFPEAWERFSNFIPEDERGDLLKGYEKRLSSASPSVSIPAAEAWAAYENSCATLKGELRGGGGRMALSLARLEAHYFCHQCFLKKDYIIKNLDKIKDIPAVLIQGRHDVICPPQTAMSLAQSWEAAELVMVEEAGHSAFEKGILKALISAMARVASKVQV